MIDEHYCARFHVLGTEVGGGDTRRWEATVIIPIALDHWRGLEETHPEGGEALHRADVMNFPVDWCARIRPIANADAQARTKRQARQLRGQFDEYDGETAGPPPTLAAAMEADLARRDGILAPDYRFDLGEKPRGDMTFTEGESGNGAGVTVEFDGGRVFVDLCRRNDGQWRIADIRDPEEFWGTRAYMGLHLGRVQCE